LRCPTCGDTVEQTAGLACARGHPLPVRRGYIDAMTSPADPLTARTLTSFGYEHTTFSERRREEEAYWRYLFSGIPSEILTDAVALDIGCGSGRFDRFLAPRVRALVVLDGSKAIEGAARNLADLSNTVAVRSDLRAIPFAPESFDLITCIGVLHHLDRPEDAFRSMVRLTAPGGRVLIFVYSKPAPGTARWFVVQSAVALRRVTVHLPHRLLRAVSAVIAAAVYAVVIVPGTVGDRFRIESLSALPLSFYRRLPLRSLWLSMFDILSAPLERRYTKPEVRTWFHDAGMEIELIEDQHGLKVLGRRRGG
jgi:SAM-dependent methyltransferase